ncbi:hypothetical protein DEU38_1397 [Rhodococcus sp. AG1013]|uniref:hypothetical protein n=1 Tax=Rhodococcus sp. AG1013 TaxID=2183996 RepID=UPI000E0AEE1B|nr:hypothetical protein [Rhodococcus sp. AG1013]RDI12038.1 hypothetical protein DEU38_1397 [Rhodococcus sp. AG1013]
MKTYGNSPNGNEPHEHDGESWRRTYRRERRTADDELRDLVSHTPERESAPLKEPWADKLKWVIGEAVARLPLWDKLDRYAQQKAPRAYLLEPGEVLRVSWGYDESGEPLDLILIDREWLFDDEDASRPDLDDISVTDEGLAGSLDGDVPDTVPEEWLD